MGIGKFFRLVITSHSGVSSKRFCGLLGWIVSLGVLVYCTVYEIEAPNMIDLVVISVLGLLGIDSVTGIWKYKDFKKKDNSANNTENTTDAGNVNDYTNVNNNNM